MKTVELSVHLVGRIVEFLDISTKAYQEDRPITNLEFAHLFNVTHELQDALGPVDAKILTESDLDDEVK